MWTRIITGVVLGPLVALLLLEGPIWGRVALFVAAASACVYELLTMAMPGRRLEPIAGTLMAIGVQIWHWFDPLGIDGQAAVFLLFPAFMVLARPRPIEAAFVRLGALWGALVYVVLPFAMGLEMAAYDPTLIIILLSLVWAGDTAAYFTGRAIGTHKLYPTVSPKKTIEGAVGGLVGSGLMTWGLTAAFYPSIGTLEALLLGVVVGTAAQAGDLTESLIKRSCGVKDSGKLLPGHGGMLDRVDGVIFAFPIFYVYFGVSGW
jgi:phosphatidate cytidylyltransferase